MPRRMRGGGPYGGYNYNPGMFPPVYNPDESEEEIDPRAYYASVDQIWDTYTVNNWLTIQTKSADGSSKANKRLIFKACKRAYGPMGPSTDDHTWIEIKSQTLINFLRAEKSLKGVDGLSATPPGVDARDLFLRLDRLKPLATEPSIKIENETYPVLPAKAKEPSLIGGLGLTVPEPDNSVSPSPPEPNTKEDAAAAENGATDKPETTSDDLVPVDETPLAAPEQLYILLKFIEEHFRDTIEELDRLKADGYMTYRLLWAICAPDSIVETKDDAAEHPTGLRVESWSYGVDGKKFTMRGSMYVWGGKVFKQETTPIEINRFKGLMKVDQVAIKVMSAQTRADLIERGKLYQKYAGVHHLNYDAFIAIHTSRGLCKLPAKGRVIVDAEGYSRYNLNTPGGYQPTQTTWRQYPPPLPPAPYTPPQNFSRIQLEEYNNEKPLPDEILCLTPPTLNGWSFGAKAWGMILVTQLSEIVFDELAFDQLVLKPEYKKMIKALIETHAGGNEGLAKDLVTGKGGGMVMVLHGKPGTGKTLTAEAISEHLKCPLYIVSSGELGLQAAQLEKQLHDILEMTAAWKAVVLIDEADVFLEARNTHDLTRNSLVSVFLRLLEYHTGVLILTTNRIRTFDKAFVSRFSIALHYPDLDQNSRFLIWKEFLTRAGVEVGGPNDKSPPTKPSYILHSDLVSLARKSFNGRVIKQLVRGAQALSIAEKEPLGMTHILTVLGITEQFEADWKELEFTDNIAGADGKQEASMYS